MHNYYKYKGTVKDSSLVKSDLVDCFGKDVADTIIYALDQCGYFIVPSDNKGKGDYILVDGTGMDFTDDDYLKDVSSIKEDTIKILNYYKKEKYIEEKHINDLLNILK